VPRAEYSGRYGDSQSDSGCAAGVPGPAPVSICVGGVQPRSSWRATLGAALAAELEPQLHDGTLLSDREHRAAENAAGEPIASAIIGSPQNGHKGLHRPDFALVRGDGDKVIAVEVELTLKSRTRLERILRGYLRNQNVAVVRYHADPPIAESVRRAARAVGADAMLELAPLPSTGVTRNRTRL